MCFPFDSHVGIIIGTIGIAVNTHKVLTVNAQTAKPLRQNITRRVPSWPTYWVPYAMIIPLQGLLIE